MESLPDAIVQFILSHLNNAKDVASCISVSKRWKDSMPFIRSLYFPRNIFDTSLFKDNSNTNPDEIILKIVSMVVQLEELVVYCPFSSLGLVSWLSVVNKSLKHLELRMDSLSEHQASRENSISKLDCIGMAKNLESLRLWGVLMTQSPKWETFENLRNLEIVGARMEDHTLVGALQLCPNLNRLLLLGCEGIRSVSINLKELEECKLDFYGAGNNSLSISCPKLSRLEVQGCGWMRVRETQCLRNLSISNSGAGKVYLVDFGKLVALETLSLRGVQWCWDAISKMLQWASEVKHLFMKVEFTGDFENLLPFPEIDFVDSSFSIPCLEEVVVTVRSPLNAEQKMSTLESFVKYARNLKKMVIKILQMKSSHSSADDFFEEVCRFRYMNRGIVKIE
ncbi:hypothetical protein RDABS01_003596 [Bienertia sinuspersici]